MSKAYFTILVVGHRGGRFRKLRITPNFVAATALIVAMVVGAAAWAPRLLVRIESQAARSEKLAQENAWLRAEKEQFETRLTRVTGRLSRFEQQAGRIADALGVEGIDVPAAAGGASDVTFVEPMWQQDLTTLDSRIERLDGSMDEVGGAFSRRMERLAATPDLKPVDGWFSHGYGWRKDPFHGRRQFHRGVDIVADRGTPIQVSASGVITRVQRVPDYGKVIDVSHGFGYVTRYGHLSEILVRAGQKVERGDVIGRVGSTGRSTGPHLHYEVHRDGRRVNPWKYLGRNRR